MQYTEYMIHAARITISNEKSEHIVSNECVRIMCYWITTIPSEQPHQTLLSRDKKQTKGNRLGGSPLFDM